MPHFIIGFLILTLVISCKSGPSPESVGAVRSLPVIKSVPFHDSPAKNSRPAWLDSIPLVMVGNWDGDPLFRNRRGGNPAWYKEEFVREHTEDAIIRLKQMGVTMVITDLFKGFGLEAESEQIAQTRNLASLCHKHGLKVGVYIGSTIFFETFLLEVPEAREWFVPDFMGKPVLWDSRQPFRKRVYFMHPEDREYIKKVLRTAIVDAKADLIHFDNTSERASGPIFFHPLAKEDFKTFLANHYSPEDLKDRLGFTDVSYVEPPVFDEPISTIDEPLFQLWTDFRCSQLASYYCEMERYIHQLNSEAVVENNPCYGLSGINTEWSCGMYYPAMLANTSVIWSEEGDEAGYTADGILVSKIRSYKMAVHLKNKIFTYTGESPLQLAEAMAYNRQCIGMVGGVLAGYELIEDREDIGFDNPYSLGAYTEDYETRKAKASYVNFFRTHFQYYRDVDNLADAAVLHSYSTLAFNNDRPYQSIYLFEQALIQGKVPFDIIYDEDLKDLTKYKVLILADVECLDENKLELIRDFVNRGGGLVATEHTSLYTEWRNRKRDFGLRDLFQINAPRWPGRGKPEAILEIQPVKNQIGNGRVVYLPEVIPALEKPAAEEMRSKFWELPVNWKLLVESVKWAAGGELSVETDAPETVTMEITQKNDGTYRMQHLLNYRYKQNAAVKNIRVSVSIPAERKTESVILYSPDSEKSQALDFRIVNERIEFVVPILKIYDLVVVRLE